MMLHVSLHVIIPALVQDGMTALMWTVQEKNDAAMVMLLQNGAEVNATSKVCFRQTKRANRLFSSCTARSD